jgi:hypothetical protein
VPRGSFVDSFNITKGLIDLAKQENHASVTRVSGKLFSRNLCMRTLFAGWGLLTR